MGVGEGIRDMWNSLMQKIKCTYIYAIYIHVDIGKELSLCHKLESLYRGFPKLQNKTNSIKHYKRIVSNLLDQKHLVDVCPNFMNLSHGLNLLKTGFN